MRRCGLTGGVLLALCAAGCGRAARVGPALAELQGAWEVTRIINGGEPVPPDDLRGMRFVFAGDKLTMSGPGEGPDEVTVAIDPTQVPAAMDLDDGGTTVLAIYRLERDALTIALPPRTAGRRPRPTTFESEPGSELGVILLKRP